jgi:5'-nucleotidase / UDP-sugar diphosphatase
MNRITLMGLLLLSTSAIAFVSGSICQCHRQQTTALADPATSSRALFSVAAAQPPQTTVAIHLSSSSPPAQLTMMTYRVRRGDRLWTIAETVYGSGNGREWRLIAQANHIDNPKHIYAGDVLIIPPLYQ